MSSSFAPASDTAIPSFATPAHAHIVLKHATKRAEVAAAGLAIAALT